ncbi:unnamed protein product, partial [Durusdinium trenchii]
ELEGLETGKFKDDYKDDDKDEEEKVCDSGFGHLNGCLQKRLQAEWGRTDANVDIRSEFPTIAMASAIGCFDMLSP